jgi:hypothetical protein
VVKSNKGNSAGFFIENMTTQEYILKKFSLSLNDKTPMPLKISQIGRDGLAELFCELGFKTGAEIGVFEGEYSEILCRSNPKLKLYCIDPWIPHKGYMDHTRKSTLENALNKTKTRLAPFNCELVKKYSQDALADFLDGVLDFVYIDGDHSFQTCTDDIVGWSKKVKIGGIIAGHDFWKNDNQHIKVYEAVSEYTKSHNLKPWFVLTAQHPRSWMWIKQQL